MNNIGVIIVTYNFSKKTLEKLINSLHKQGIAKKAIYIVDNTFDNRGYSGGINLALKKIIKSYKYFLILNPDITLYKDLVTKLLESIEHSKNYGIVGPKILNEKGKLWSLGGNLDKIRYSGGLNLTIEGNKRNVPVDFISGTAMLIRRNVFTKIGLFDEDYFLYYEDVDFCQRASQAGFLSVVDREAIIIHSASTTVGKNSNAMLYYMARNHLLFQERYAPMWIKIREILRLPKTLYEARERKSELLGIIDYFLRRFGRNKKILSKVDAI